MMKNEINEEFQKYIYTFLKTNNFNEIIQSGFEYTLLSKSKYVRPLLLLVTLKAYNIDYKKYFDVALAIEMIHTYSLIHDDLPSMDDDNYRRGKPSAHIKFGEGNAVLIGDALLTHAFSQISNNTTLNDDSKIHLINLLIESSGAQNGMISGQISDINTKVKNVEDLNNIHLQKTGKMIKNSLISAYFIYENQNFKKKTNQLFIFNELGEKLGLFYQIQDDYFDTYSTFEDIGKEVGKDINKKTYTYFYSQKELLNKMSFIKEEINSCLKKINLPILNDYVSNILVRKN